jgi:hypothetical protein
MKKILQCLIGIFICIVHIQARKLPGYYITKTNDTVRVVFKVPMLLGGVPSYDRLQKRIKCFDSNHKKIILKPDSAEEVCFVHKGEKIRMLSRPFETYFDFFSGPKSFLRLLIDGNLKLFKYYRKMGGYNGSSSIPFFLVGKYVIQKGNDKLFRTSPLSYKSDMKAYLSDCPSASEKIEKSNGIKQMVEEYNKVCK